MLRTILVLTCLSAGFGPAEAKPARCETTDDGAYACDFQTTDSQGSFSIKAGGKPTYLLNVDSPGIGQAFANFGTRNVALPGPYRTDRRDPACWVSDATKTKICAR